MHCAHGVYDHYLSRKFLSMLALVLWMLILLLWILSATEHVVSELKDCTRMELGAGAREDGERTQ